MNAPRVRLRHRFFYALFPPPPLAAEIAQRFAVEGVRMIRADRLHVTIDLSEDFADYPDGVVQGLIAAGSQVDVPPFALTFDSVVDTPYTMSLRPEVPDPAMQALHDAIVAARVNAGVEGREGYAFTPHMTLAYRRGLAGVRSIPPVGLTVDRFVLVHSLIGQGRYDEIGCWPSRVR
ncbi:2'-5' RNA ligase family protein [Sphingomonas aliaeris]|uniref:2'-5' RNA ligase family protein n=1 Tax=Sphingomonas aliaeris TaxID=2759526 RepID=A0A974NUG1_9SPHN|nr:2'-5' RNA ligase family protein [Sphingomonas aliaeris]QQV77102.1 2'-5' RNA ligase family protein [Sphingomonas aliaeris]